MLIDDCFKCGKQMGGNFGYRGKYGQYNYKLCGVCRDVLIKVAKERQSTELEILINYERKKNETSNDRIRT
jgi:uncharacterized protein YijF (DUF1287 family)